MGDFGFVRGPALGHEIDRLDYDLGTPRNAMIVATSKLAGDHSDDYHLFNEESIFPMIDTTGTTSVKIRSDLVFFETATRGAVFSVGSMNWAGALAWKNHENNVARITANALHEFVHRESRLVVGHRSICFERKGMTTTHTPAEPGLATSNLDEMSAAPVFWSCMIILIR